MRRFLSIASGIEAASVAFGPLGWKAAGFSEIEPFPCAVLAHHYPDTPNLGDMTKIGAEQIRALGHLDLVCGGCPCQAFSVAGLRQSLSDTRGRGNLTLDFVRICDLVCEGNPDALVFYENVPGILSTSDNAFGCFLGAMVGADDALEPGGNGKWPGAGVVSGPKRNAVWRVLDAQHFGVPQRRRRVFVLAGRAPAHLLAEVLLEPESLRGHPAPRREAREGVAGTLAARTHGGGGLGTDFDLDGGLVAGGCAGVDLRNATLNEDLCGTLDTAQARINNGHGVLAFGGNNQSGPITTTALNAKGGSGRMDFESETLLVEPIAFDECQVTSKNNRSQPAPGRECHTLSRDNAARAAIAFNHQEDRSFHASTTTTTNPLRAEPGRENHTLSKDNAAAAVAIPAPTTDCIGHFEQNSMAGRGTLGYADGCEPLRPVKPQADHQMLVTPMQIRRLTPVECARLQGFPDDYLDVEYRGKPACDGPKYKALGNSWAVPCVRWIGARIDLYFDPLFASTDCATSSEDDPLFS